MKKDDPQLEYFLGLSAILTGFEMIDLAATGVAAAYFDTFSATPNFDTIMNTWAGIVGQWPGDRTAQEQAVGAQMWTAASGMLGSLQQLTQLWYLGVWFDGVTNPNGTPLSAEAYEQGLVWPAVGTKPLGTRPTGYGSWSTAPVMPVLPDGGVQ